MTEHLPAEPGLMMQRLFSPQRRRAADRWRLSVIVLALCLLPMLAGCTGRQWLDFGGGEGSLQVRGFGEPSVRLDSRLSFGVYAERDGVEHSFILSDLPLEELVNGDAESGQIVHVEFLWTPRPGSTPVEATAVNVSVRHIVISQGEIGIYSGAGFAWVRGELGADQITLVIRDASLKLTDSTEDFVDLLTPARLSGTMGVQRDDRLTRQMHYAISQMVTDKLGVSRFVLLDAPGSRIVAGNLVIPGP